MKINLIPAINYYNVSFTGKKHSVQQQRTHHDEFIRNGNEDFFIRNHAAGSSGIASKTVEDLGHTASNTAAAIFRETEEPCKKFKSTLELLLKDLIADHNYPKRPVVKLDVSAKSKYSIQEKMAAKRIRSKKEAKAKIDDLIRARVILNTATSNEGDAIVEKLIEAVKFGKLKVVEITSYRPNNPKEKKKYEYVKTSKVEELRAVAKANGQNPEVIDREKETGYIATHIIFLLESGYRAELQIMGADVARLKEIEDICFKIKCNKKVDRAFGEIATAMKTVKADPDLMNAYNSYTKDAYKYERLKYLGKRSRDDNTDFLKLTDPSIPEVLDFNNVARIVDSVNRKKAAKKLS